MAYATSTVLAVAAIASAAATAVGTGLSYYSQQQQASNARAVADYNYEVQQQNAQINATVAAQQNAWQQQVYANQQAMANQNAAILADQGRAAEAQAREQARRERDTNEKVLARQRASYAKGGVTSEGSPITIMAETASLLELKLQDIAYEGDMKGRSFDRQAALARMDGAQSMFDAGVAEYELAAKDAGFAIDLNQARIDRIAGYSTAAGYESAATGTLISGVGSAIGSLGSAYSTYAGSGVNRSTSPGGLYNPNATVRRATI